jgi:hypothetical protein
LAKRVLIAGRLIAKLKSPRSFFARDYSPANEEATCKLQEIEHSRSLGVHTER